MPNLLPILICLRGNDTRGVDTAEDGCFSPSVTDNSIESLGVTDGCSEGFSVSMGLRCEDVPMV